VCTRVQLVSSSKGSMEANGHTGYPFSQA